MQELADRLQQRHHSVVELVNRAQGQGLVQRAAHPSDRRAVRVAADTAGRASPDTRQRAAPRRIVADGRGTHPSELGQHASRRARNPRDYLYSGPRDIITVIIPAYVAGHWWEQLLHNQSALRLKTRLLFLPNVVTVDIPWPLPSAGGLGLFGFAGGDVGGVQVCVSFAE